ncbi:MAG: HAD-IIA family hydrolase [Anaerolineales bacterium]
MDKTWISELKGIVLDMDGVLWKGPQPLVDLPAVFSLIEERGWNVLGMTNNSTRTPTYYLSKLESFGVELENWQVINSSETTAYYLKKKYSQGGAVYMIGERGLRNALKDQGFYLVDDKGKRKPLAVVAGMDRNLTYKKIEKAARFIREGIPFLGTNPDKTYPTPEGLAPGAGVVLAAIEAASGVQPLVMGKPQQRMYQVALDRLSCSPEKTLVVGDRLETDILGAQNAGCRSALVLSGVASKEDLRNWTPAPDLVGDDVLTLFTSLLHDE